MDLVLGYLVWSLIEDLDAARDRPLPSFGPGLSEDRRMQRGWKLEELGSQAVFPSGMAMLGDDPRSSPVRPVMAVVTPGEFVYLAARSDVDPETELARLPRFSVGSAEVVDGSGNILPEFYVNPPEELGGRSGGEVRTRAALGGDGGEARCGFPVPVRRGRGRRSGPLPRIPPSAEAGSRVIRLGR